MIVSTLITFLVLVWLVGVFINIGLTGLFLQKPPTGERAMGLIVPIFSSGIASLAMMLATFLCVGRGGADWISSVRVVPTMVASAVMFGVCLSMAGALGAWMGWQNRWSGAVAALGFVCGVMVPLAACGLMLVCAWTDPGRLAGLSGVRLVGWVLVGGAAVGYALGAIGLEMTLAQAARNHEATTAANQEFDEKWRRIREMPRGQRVREELEAMSSETPLWVFVAYLPEEDEQQTRELVIDRALKVPGFLEDLERTMTSETHLYRYGCAELIRYARPEHRDPAWAVALARSIRVTAGEMERRPAWLTETSRLNPNPMEHLVALVEATAALGNPPEAVAAMRELSGAVEQLAPGTGRDQAAKKLADATR
jgi:plasmid stabilization system protein ParE